MFNPATNYYWSYNYHFDLNFNYNCNNKYDNWIYCLKKLHLKKCVSINSFQKLTLTKFWCQDNFALFFFTGGNRFKTSFSCIFSNKVSEKKHTIKAGFESGSFHVKKQLVFFSSLRSNSASIIFLVHSLQVFISIPLNETCKAYVDGIVPLRFGTKTFSTNWIVLRKLQPIFTLMLLCPFVEVTLCIFSTLTWVKVCWPE